MLGIKEIVTKNKDFKTYFKDCLKDKKLNGAGLAEELVGDGIIKRLESIKKKIEKENARLEKQQKLEKQKVLKKTSKPVMGM